MVVTSKSQLKSRTTKQPTLLDKSELNLQKIFSSVSVLNTEDQLTGETNDLDEEEEKILSARDRSHSLPSGTRKYSRQFRLLRYRNTFTRWLQSRNICKQCRHHTKSHPETQVFSIITYSFYTYMNKSYPIQLRMVSGKHKWFIF